MVFQEKTLWGCWIVWKWGGTEVLQSINNGWLHACCIKTVVESVQACRDGVQRVC
jgi:hypothetical protein